MIFVFLLVFCAVIADAAKEGDFCIKEGAVGLCTNIKNCPDAQEDIKNKKRPQICEFYMQFIVCCVSTVNISTSPQDDVTTTQRPKGNCVLPPYPEHGTYNTTLADSSGPGEAYEAVAINVTCGEGYDVDGPRFILCVNGHWSEQIPKCTVLCRLLPHPSVKYNCLVTDGGLTGTRPCKEYELHGTVVSPECQAPNYYTPTALQFMRCIDGTWDYVAKCSPECGTVTPDGMQLVAGGESAKHGEVPWHAGIYSKTKKPYVAICGGSLVSTSVVITAAHCFWNDVTGKQPESDYAVAVGSLYRAWDAAEADAQRSDVKELHLPERFRGGATNFQEDIAVVIVSVAFELKTYIRPVCLDFDITFERRQLQPGNKGKVAGWGLTAANGNTSPELQVIDLPYVSLETCISDTSINFHPYITSDKVCAGFKNAGKALCKGDTGGGLAFPELDRGIPRHYLRGVVSIAPIDENLCNVNTYSFFTQVSKHQHFINEFLVHYL